MSKVCIFDHPLIQHKLSVLRDKNTSSKEFRELISEIAMLMCFEATRDLPLEEVTVETPVAVAKCHRLAGKKLDKDMEAVDQASCKIDNRLQVLQRFSRYRRKRK